MSCLTFQANAVTVVNGFTIKMIAHPNTPMLSVCTSYGDLSVDMNMYNYTDPADIAAAFAKYADSINYAVMAEPKLYEETG